MFKSTSLSDWENLVEKQLKTEQIYDVLKAENLESIDVKPYYDANKNALQNLPKIAESTFLVANYHENLEDEVLAFLLDENVGNLTEKSIFISNKNLAEHIINENDNQYYSLIDVFDVQNGTLNEQLAKELLAKDFTRNICVDVSFIQNCGASVIQQLAIAIAKCKELVEVFGTEIFNKIVFKVAIGNHFFFEIAKIRALKLLFNQLSKEYNLNEIPFIFAETSLRNKTKADAENNLLRSTLEISAAMIAGSDAVFSNDFKIENNNTLSEEISFKQQIILAYESIINVFDDAANGSYFVENCTQQFAGKSWQKFLEIESNGGYSANFLELKNDINSHAKQEHLQVQKGKIKLVGSNVYPTLEITKSVEEFYNSGDLKAVRWSEIYE